MPNTPELSEVRRALLEKYLRKESPITAGISTQQIQGNSAPLSSTDLRVPLLPIQTNGSKLPFFYAHTHWVGGAFYSFALAHSLGTDQPFYLLDPYKFVGLKVIPSFEEIAEAYIESVQTIQPEGPYLLGGFCGGGLLALEMAHQLRSKGHEVDLLVLIEPGAGPIQYTRMLGRFVRRMGNLMRIGPDKQVDWFLRLRHMYRLLRYEEDEKNEHLKLVPSKEALRQDWMGILVWALSNYVPPPQYQGKIAFFWAGNDTYRRESWPKVAKSRERGEVYVISGTHMGIVTDQLPVLSDQLKTCLENIFTIPSC